MVSLLLFRYYVSLSNTKKKITMVTRGDLSFLVL